MAEKMIHTHVYLPRAIYDELQRQAKKHGLTLAAQIREVLEGYVYRKGKREEKLQPFDPRELFEIIDNLEGGGPDDLAENHDKYIYGDPHGEKSLERQRSRSQSQPKPASAVRERRVVYQTKRRQTPKRKGQRR